MPDQARSGRLRAVPSREVTSYRVRISVPRRSGRREWEASRGVFEQRLDSLESPAVIGAEIESETRRGRDFVRVTIAAAVDAADVAEALTAAWDGFRQAAGDDAAGWDMTAAVADIQLEAHLSIPSPPELARPDPGFRVTGRVPWTSGGQGRAAG